MSFRIIGTGRCVPEYVLTNEEISTMVETSDEWISTRTGIKERRICTKETITDLAVTAAKNALEDAKAAPEELDMIICGTIRGEFISPSEACVIQKKLGARCPAFDVNAACSGFLYCMDVAAGFFARKRVKKVLVVCADNVSNCSDWNDRATCVLFGDGAGAAVRAEGSDLLSIELTTTGDYEYLRIPRGENACPMYRHPSERPVLHMNGREVYKFAVNAMVTGLQNAVAAAGLKESDIDHVMPHQANMRIIEAAKAKLSFAPEKYFYNITRYGNTSAACIPMMLDEANRAGKLKKGDYIAMAAFGGGLTSGSAVLRWNAE